MLDRKFMFIVGGALIFIAVVVVIMIAMGSSEKKPPKVTGPTILTIWGYDEDRTIYDQIFNEFQTDNKNVKVQYDKKNIETYASDAIDSIASGKGPDIWIVPNNWIPKFHDKMIAVKETAFEDKSLKKDGLEVYKDTFPPVVFKDMTINNKIYGIPMTIDTLKLYYNPVIFSHVLADYEEKHLEEDIQPVRDLLTSYPQNWEEILKLIKLITVKNGDSIDRSAIALGTNNNIRFSDDIVKLLMMQNGAEAVSPDFKSARFQTQYNAFGGVGFPGAQALKFYASFADPKSENYTWNTSMPDVVRAFAEGKTAMMISYDDVLKDITLINPQANFVAVPFPQIKQTASPVNLASYNAFTVTKASKNPDLAWDLVLKLAVNYDSLGNYYSNLAVKKNMANIKMFGIPSDPIGNQIMTSKNWFEPDPQKTPTIFKDMINQANEGKDIQTAVEGAAAQCTSLLQKLDLSNQ